MNTTNIENVIKKLQEDTDRIINNPPSMSLWTLCKLIWYALRGKQVYKAKLHPPYEIEFETGPSTE